jgi:Domain of unknown function (DUF3883)
MVSDPVIEGIAMREAMAYEEAHGWAPEDVSKENRRFDVLSHQRGGPGVRFIEVKGRATFAPVALTSNEYRTAKRLGEDFWLYAVFDCGLERPACPSPGSRPAWVGTGSNRRALHGTAAGHRGGSHR